ncbi:unnamed protein product [Nesidiocoris tenuis]|uniref:Uncharacterized protein n=1 Tax=Nesidiocoris tenuis TaxID=355587 RepID=A0A6H5HHF6_9HEMI|nr:unnamed protein product [Nesidiocoris tenuis]
MLIRATFDSLPPSSIRAAGAQRRRVPSACVHITHVQQTNSTLTLRYVSGRLYRGARHVLASSDFLLEGGSARPGLLRLPDEKERLERQFSQSFTLLRHVLEEKSIQRAESRKLEPTLQGRLSVPCSKIPSMSRDSFCPRRREKKSGGKKKSQRQKKSIEELVPSGGEDRRGGFSLEKFFESEIGEKNVCSVNSVFELRRFVIQMKKCKFFKSSSRRNGWTDFD